MDSDGNLVSVVVLGGNGTSDAGGTGGVECWDHAVGGGGGGTGGQREEVGPFNGNPGNFAATWNQRFW